jgi:hypothetical protein
LTASKDDSGHTAHLEDEIRALADRLTALERTVGQSTASAPGAPPTVPDAPAGQSEVATFRYSGSGRIGPVHMRVNRRASLEAVLTADPGLVGREFAALASPVRFVLLRAMLDGPRTSQQLREVLDAGSVGQLYHHLKELLSAGMVIQPGRNLYAIPESKVVDVCLSVVAAIHLASTSHQTPPPPPGPLADDEEP